MSPGPYAANLIPEPTWLSGYAEGLKQTSRAWIEDRANLGRTIEVLVGANRNLCDLLGALTMEANGTLFYRGVEGPVPIPPAIQEKLKSHLHIAVFEVTVPKDPGGPAGGPKTPQG